MCIWQKHQSEKKQSSRVWLGVSATAGLFLPTAALAETGRALGNVNFETTCSAQSDAAFNEGLGLLHHMMYFQAGRLFSSAAETDPDCAMLFWGVAMSKIHPLWPGLPSAEVISAGRAAVAQMAAANDGSAIEQGFAAAVSAYYEGEDTPYRARIAAWGDAQKAVYTQSSDNEDATAFYALSLLATAPRGDKSLKNQREAGALLEALNESTDLHPGAYHYSIHAYDNPVLYEKALPFAAKYGKIAPDVAHALHMPTHIFVRAGQWDDVVEWNTRSSGVALADPLDGMISSHYAHAMDYLIYGHLQRGETETAEKLLDDFLNVGNQRDNFGSAYALAAAPLRVALEQSQWAKLADLNGTDMHPAIAWEKFPQTVAMRWFAIGLGAARSGDADTARSSLSEMAQLRSTLEERNQGYWIQLLEAQMLSIEAWLELDSGNIALAISLQTKAADIEDAAGKSPVTPGHVLPARELLGDLYAELGRAEDATIAYEATLTRSPNRRRSILALQ